MDEVIKEDHTDLREAQDKVGEGDSVGRDYEAELTVKGTGELRSSRVIQSEGEGHFWKRGLYHGK